MISSIVNYGVPLIHCLYSYALVATATDYDAWRPDQGVVTASEVFKTLTQNAETSRYVAAKILDEIHGVFSTDGGDMLEEVGSMKFSIMPRSAQQNPDDRKKLAYVLPEYFSD